jgi:phosphatidylglycerophosphate synthase
MDNLAVKISQSGLSANKITAIRLVVGLTGCFLVALQLYPAGLVLLLVSLFLDGLDGAVARATQITEFGTWFNMISTVVLYAAFPFFFMLSSSDGVHATAAGMLLFSFLLMGMANLSYDYFAMKNGAAPARGGLVESSEIILFMIVSCLYAAGFSFFAAILALLSLIAAITRMVSTAKLLKV